MRHFQTTTLSFFLLLTIGSRAAEPLATGDRAPDWMLSDNRGEHIAFYQDSAGQAAVLLFWATWCSSCPELMPALEKLRRETAGEKIKFYALNIWEDGDPAAYLRDKNLGFTLLLEADTVAKRYQVRSTPNLFVVRPDKSIVYIHNKNNNMDEVYRAVKTALDGGEAPGD